MMASGVLNPLILSALSEYKSSRLLLPCAVVGRYIEEECAAYIFINNVVGVKMFPCYVGRVTGNVAALN
jgi:hypothetical protein